jgi:type II secretion system (T2SS) protein F/ClpX C4-type zinc finger protein
MAKRTRPEDAAVAITSGELALFCRQVGTMLLAGVDVLRALRVAGDQTESVRLRSVAQRIGRDMSAGRVMAWSLSRFPDLFSPFFVHMVRQGESEGVLGEVLTTMADYLEREQGPVPGHLQGPAGHGFDIDEAIAKLRPLIFWQMLTLGVIALGIGALIWAHREDWLPGSAFGADIALWIGGCLMLSALIFGRFRPPKVERCSFCGRAQANPSTLMKGHGVAICSDCIRSNVEQMKSEARRQLEATADDGTEAAPLADPAPHADRPYPSNGRTYPTDDGDEGKGKQRIQL